MMIIEIIKTVYILQKHSNQQVYFSASVTKKIEISKAHIMHDKLLKSINSTQFISQSETDQIQMKGDLQPRPESKNRNSKIRPVSRYANKELASECFKNGKELQKKQAFEKAIEQYLRALMYDPSYFQSYCNMGSCYRSQGKYLVARSMYLKSISIKEDDTISHYNLANIERIIGNYQNSIVHYEFVIKISEGAGQNIGSLLVNSLINLGICCKMTEQYDRAIQCYEKARKIDPSDDSIIYNQAMIYMAMLQSMNIELFQEVSKQRALKAEILLKQLLKTKPNHEMASIKLCRVSSILDKSTENLNKNVSKLKSMLRNQKSTLKDEINFQLGYLLNLLKQYEKSASHYKQSVSNVQQKVTSKKSIEVNVYDSQDGYLNSKLAIYSEEQAITMIKQGKIDQAKESITRMQDSNISKHVIQLAIQLQLTENESQDHFKSALEIYTKYFTSNNQELPFEKVSIEAHKLIGKILSKQNKYKQSIKHFQYISSQLKSNAERSAVHTSLGSEYEAMGDKEKALQQYKFALEQQPQNYELIYNVGCCLHDRGEHEQSNKYFEAFLDLIKKDTKIFLPTKNLYIADCLVTMAGSTASSSQEFERYQNAWKAIKEVQEGEEQSDIEFDSQKMLNYYLRWADLLEGKIVDIADKKSDQYLSSKQILLQVYINLLETEGCPDRDAILSNCAIIYYEEKLYVNALANLNLITVHNAFSYNSLALTYFHLGQHFMATKSMYSALQLDQNDSLIKFNKDMIEWVYGISKSGNIYDHINNQDDSLIFVRWEYAVLVMDSLSRRLKTLSQDIPDSEISELISKIFQKNNIQQYLDQIEGIKFKYVKSKLQSSRQVITKGGPNLHELIKFCATPTHNIEGDLKQLLHQLESNRQLNDTNIQLLLNIFIFTNKDKSHSIKAYLQGISRNKQEVYTINLDRRVTIPEDSLSKQYSFSNSSDIASNLCTWECELQNKIIVLLHLVEKIFYHLGIKGPLEAQYHFPRHNQLEDCSVTINRMITLIYNTFKIKTNINIKEKTILKMKRELIDEIQADFQIQMRKQSFLNLTLGEQLRILTLHANFTSRDECAKFIRELQRQSNNKKQIDIGKHEDGVLILISNIMAVSCTWSEKNGLKQAIKSLLKSPLEIYQQSILELQENLYLIQDQSQAYWGQLSKIEAFENK